MTYRTEIGEDNIQFLVEGNEAGPGPLASVADHIRDEAPGVVLLDNTALDRLRDLPEHYDGSLTETVDEGLVIHFGGTGYPVTYVSE